MLTIYQKLLLRKSAPLLNYQTSFSRLFIDSKPSYFFFKRVFDLVFSVFVMVFILSWFVPLLGIIIKMDSRGTVFFLQRRIGKGGRIFLCIKFRTMTQNMEADTKQAVENDYRITRVGKLLRMCSIDELPQFINVFLGQMSVIGPRPHMLSDCRKFSELVPGYKFRNFVRPGITGLAQIKGYRGLSKDHRNILRRFQYDAFYIRNTNFGLDLRIIRVTVAQVTIALFKNKKKRRSLEPKKSEKYGKIAA